VSKDKNKIMVQVKVKLPGSSDHFVAKVPIYLDEIVTCEFNGAQVPNAELRTQIEERVNEYVFQNVETIPAKGELQRVLKILKEQL
jgi:hypothetical protein